MEITVNHQNYQLTSGCTISKLLSEVLRTNGKSIAVAINQNVVPKSTWQNHILQAGDQVILIKATPGG
jgi:sulfur carrier protein